MADSPIILLLTHGKNCEELLRSTEMIYGPASDVITLPLLEGDDPDEYEAKVAAIVDEHEGNLLIMVDLKGGTPFNTFMKVGRTRELYAVAGVNLPMMLEALFCRDEMDVKELAEHVAEAGRESIVVTESYFLHKNS